MLPSIGDALHSSSHAAALRRELSTTTIVACGSNAATCGANLATAYANAADGDVLLLQDGTYTGSGTTMLTVSKSITLRAQTPGQAVLDGQNARRVLRVSSGTVVVDGLSITRGSVSAHSPGIIFLCPRWKTFP